MWFQEAHFQAPWSEAPATLQAALLPEAEHLAGAGFSLWPIRTALVYSAHNCTAEVLWGLIPFRKEVSIVAEKS